MAGISYLRMPGVPARLPNRVITGLGPVTHVFVLTRKVVGSRAKPDHDTSTVPDHDSVGIGRGSIHFSGRGVTPCG